MQTTNTPWGLTQYTEELAEGVLLVSTPSHGGIHLSRERNAKVPKRYRDFAALWSKGWGDNWYEEDCAMLAVAITYPELFPHVTDVDALREQLESYLDD